MFGGLAGLFGGGNPGGPTPLGAFGGGGGGGGLLSKLSGAFQGGLSSPGSSALLGAGGALMNAGNQGQSMGQALQAGIGGAAGGFIGGQQYQQQQEDEERRRKMMEQLMGRMGGLSRGAAAGGPGGGGGGGLLTGGPRAGGGGLLSGVGVPGGPRMDVTNPLFTGLI